MCRARAFFIFVFLTLLPLARAHDPGLSSASLTLSASRIELSTTFSLLDARWLLANQKGEGFSADDGERLRAELSGRPTRLLWHLVAGQSELLPSNTSVELVARNNVVFVERYSAPSSGTVHFQSNVFDLLPPGHRQHATVLSAKHEVVLAKLLSQAEPGFDFALPPIEGSLSSEVSALAKPVTVSFFGFLRLGIEHILTGYDHLLFLFAFLIAAKNLSAVLKIITGFTIAHSITLALSALDIVSLPPRWVEPLIAATIVFVAVQNLLRRDRPGERLSLTFTFGLIHGFGFASVLREMGISSLGTSAWRALAGFNAGVELGQIAVASAVLPLLWYLRSGKNYERSWAPAGSALIALAGAYWFYERIGGHGLG